MIERMTGLDLTSLKSAFAQLENGVRAAQAEPTREIIRDGAIQRFEYCYELAVKMIKRVLEMHFAENVDQMPFNDLLRTAAERGLIDDPEKWFAYRNDRNQTSHTYNGSVAETVYHAAERFVPDVRILLKNIERYSH